MLIVAAAFVALVVVTFGTEIQFARRGPDLVAPDTKTLAATFASRSPAAADRAVKVLWLGDSTAAGVGASDPEHALSSQVGRHLIDTGSPYAWDMHVIAVSGDRVKDVLDDQLPQVDDYAPDVVVISVGANDTIHFSGGRTFRHRYEQLIRGLTRQHIPADHIVLVGVPDMGAPTRLAQPLRTVAGWRGRRIDRQVKRVGREQGARFVDLFHATTKPFRAHPSTYLAGDKYHPSDAGYRLWAGAIAPAVATAAG